MLLRVLGRAIIGGAFTAAISVPVAAQNVTLPGDVRAGMWAGGELDNYLRYLQTLGAVKPFAWSLRGFNPRVIEQITAVRGSHPWRERLAQPEHTSHWFALPLEATLHFNSTYPFGSNDGPIWVGKGVTTSLQAGVGAQFGILTIVIDPIFFRAENTRFALRPTGAPGQLQFADPDFPSMVDRPQRFGDGAYQHLDWGETTVRVDAGGVALGVTTASEWWGPATVFPYILSNNAAGIPRIFIGTESPVSIGIGRVGAQLQYGIADQSAYSAVTGPATYVSPTQPGRRRFISGVAVTFQPRVIPTLEIGVGRFFHEAWGGHLTTAYLRTPFEGILKSSLPKHSPTDTADTRDLLKNQLASLFFRWQAPRSGFELYGEYGREDHSLDLRDLTAEPDHSRTTMVGFRKAFWRADSGFAAIRLEIMDASAPSLARNRSEGGIYVHSPLLQGHTLDGQLLGADIGVGSAAGAMVAFDNYTAEGRTTLYIRRIVEHNPTLPPGTMAIGNPRPEGLEGTIGLDRLAIREHSDIGVGLALTYRGGFADGARGLNLTASSSLSLPKWH